MFNLNLTLLLQVVIWYHIVYNVLEVICTWLPILVHFTKDNLLFWKNAKVRLSVMLIEAKCQNRSNTSETTSKHFSLFDGMELIDESKL